MDPEYIREEKEFEPEDNDNQIQFISLNEWKTMSERLAFALRPFANYACSPTAECECHNCFAAEVLRDFDSLTGVDKE